MRLSIQVKKFEVLTSYWDCKVPPKLEPIEDEIMVKALMQKKAIEIQRKYLQNMLKDEHDDPLTDFGKHSRRAGKNGQAKPLTKGLSIITYMSVTAAKDLQVIDKAKRQKLEPMLLSMGISTEHIPRISKKIDDLHEKNESRDEGGDSDIDEPNVDEEAVQLDEFEALFRVPIEEDKQAESTVTDFKIQRGGKKQQQSEPQKESALQSKRSGLKVKVSGGIPETEITQSPMRGVLTEERKEHLPNNGPNTGGHTGVQNGAE